MIFKVKIYNCGMDYSYRIYNSNTHFFYNFVTSTWKNNKRLGKPDNEKFYH